MGSDGNFFWSYCLQGRARLTCMFWMVLPGKLALVIQAPFVNLFTIKSQERQWCPFFLIRWMTELSPAVSKPENPLSLLLTIRICWQSANACGLTRKWWFKCSEVLLCCNNELKKLNYVFFITCCFECLLMYLFHDMPANVQCCKFL